MLGARLALYLLLPHALGTASTITGQVALCLVLFFILLVEANITSAKDITLLRFAIVPLSIVALLSGHSETATWTLHLATVLLPMALTKTEQRSGQTSVKFGIPQ